MISLWDSFIKTKTNDEICFIFILHTIFRRTQQIHDTCTRFNDLKIIKELIPQTIFFLAIGYFIAALCTRVNVYKASVCPGPIEFIKKKTKMWT